MNETFDLLIIGGSAAAATAGVYAKRRGLNFKIITKEFGGEVATSGVIENWPGITSTDGLSLSDQFKTQLKDNGIVPEEGIEVRSITRQDDGLFCISTAKDGEAMASDKLVAHSDAVPICDYQAKSIIVATGVHPRELGVPGEKEFRNKGVTYCTTCDGPLFQDKITTVVGGGNSALEAALMLADIAKQVYVVNKNSQFKGEQVLIDNLNSKKNVKIIYNAKTTEIIGEQFVTGLRYTNEKGETEEIATDGVFVHIGMIPNSGLVPAEVQKNNFGEIIVDDDCATNISGLFAAGDVTNVSFKQIVIAAGQGCVAALSVVQYLNRK